jgi:phosphoribosylanthranilate isomerase
VKICGLTRREDALRAVEHGADAVGFVFWNGSPRVIAAAAAAAITRDLPAFVTRVGVFVNAAPDEVRAIVETAALDVVQLHGDEDVEQYRGVGARLMRVIALEADADVAAALDLPPDVMPLVDAADRERRGGTGRLADWTRAARVAAARPVVLAGGLHAGNVVEAIRAVRPWAIDVSSGVETAPGIKNHEKMAQLFAQVRAPRTEEL